MNDSTLRIETLGPSELAGCPAWLNDWVEPHTGEPLSVAPTRWLPVLSKSLGHEVYCIRASVGESCVGLLPLAYVRSWLFGKYLVSLPYINSAGIQSESEEATAGLLDAAVQLADQLNVRYLELRQEQEVNHAALTQKNAGKVIMRLNLPAKEEDLWNSFKSKLRSQIKSGQKNDFEILWGGLDLLDDFYEIFSWNMRDLGTPVFPRELFAQILTEFASDAELCVLKLNHQAVAAALLIHGVGRTEVPSASSLRAFNSTNANMVMYWHLLRRAVHRGQTQFDFGRSTAEGSTFKFKEQWGAVPHSSIWQYYVRHGSIGEMRPTNAKFGLAIKIWQKLPLSLTRMLGPLIVRGIP
jgi:FemAB-related protein (PEP-CTERM system-associated)